MTEKIVKIYMDIESPYTGPIPINDKRIYRDYSEWRLDLGIIGMLGLEIDTYEKTIKELWFYQRKEPIPREIDQYFEYFEKSDMKTGCPRPLINIMKLSGYGYFEDSNWGVFNWRKTDNMMLVTFNGRNFDLPIMMEMIGNANMNMKKDIKKDIINKVLTKDRDLIDICLKRGISIKGGLPKVIENLGIDNPYSKEMDDAMKSLMYNGYNKELKDTSEREYYDLLRLVGEKNEADIRLLPKIEEKLGLLYLPRVDEDKYVHNWN